MSKPLKPLSKTFKSVQKPKQARLIITFECERQCPGCCNHYKSIMQHAKKAELKDLKDYEVVMLTGGEPMLDWKHTLEIAKTLKAQNPQVKVYLYTAHHRFPSVLKTILEVVDGIQYSIHENASYGDYLDFHDFQHVIQQYPNKSFRLYIDPKGNDKPLAICPNLWKRVEVKAWLTEEQLLALQPNGLPQNEDLFILTNH